MNKQTYICKSCVFVVSCSVALNRSHTHMHTHTHHTEQGSVCNTPGTPRPASVEQKPLPVDTALPSFSSKKTVVSLHHPQPPSKKALGGWVGAWVGGGHVYRCYASSQCTNHDDNLNDDDDKDDDLEECRLTKHLTPVSRQESNIWLPQNDDESSLRAIICES